MGKLAHLYGPRRIFNAGLVLVALFNLLSVYDFIPPLDSPSTIRFRWQELGDLAEPA